jgi:hypothetical protein
LLAVKERPILFSGAMVRAILEGRKTQTRRVVKPKVSDLVTHCPYGAPGARLWVREAWLRDRYDGSTQYRASHPCPELPRWKPSIHMPRERCRLVLELVRVRLERLQDISEEDARAEGFPSYTITGNGQSCEPVGAGYMDGRAHFRALWDSLNAKRGFGWSENPWVWALEFRRLEPLTFVTIEDDSARPYESQPCGFSPSPEGGRGRI